jgi:hypothetical protein
MRTEVRTSLIEPTRTFDEPHHCLVGHARQTRHGFGNGDLVSLIHVCVTLAKMGPCFETVVARKG